MRLRERDIEIHDDGAYRRSQELFRADDILLPTFAELADPRRIPLEIEAALDGVDPDEPDPRNLFRAHWYNADDRRARVDVPGHLLLGEELTGVRAPIYVLLGDRFPIVRSHKLLSTYGSLAQRIVSGRFDPRRHRAVWPSTGNFARAGVALSRILGYESTVILPSTASAGHVRWLEDWIDDPDSVVRTSGTESDVKAISDAALGLAENPDVCVFDQFGDYGNYLAHAHCTSAALGRVFEAARRSHPGLELSYFVAATGSAGTLGAGDALKEHYGTRICAVEALQCPTMLRGGYGSHRIHGIGDHHIPLIHNVMNTDLVCAVSDKSTDRLAVLFDTDTGREWLTQDRGLAYAAVQQLIHLGASSIANVLAAIRLARTLDLGPEQAILTVATDNSEMYGSEVLHVLERDFPLGFHRSDAAAIFEQHLATEVEGTVLELDEAERTRIFNLGYFTWVESGRVASADFEVRRSPDFWRGVRQSVGAWDERIAAFNAEVRSLTV